MVDGFDLVWERIDLRDADRELRIELVSQANAVGFD
jgi:hypothetical protein